MSPKLVMHYAPDILVVLKRSDCPGRLAGWSSKPQHGSCACDKNHDIFTVVKAHWLRSDEEKWCLEQCWWPRREKA